MRRGDWLGNSQLASVGSLAAPDHAFAEVAEVLTRKVRLGQAVLGQTVVAMQAIAAEIEPLRLDGLLPIAMSISFETGASVYDCLYVAAARSRGCQLLTADMRLIARLADTAYQPLLLPLASANSPR